MRASSPMGRKFVIADPATCIGCKTCMAACFHRHDVPNDVAVPRLTLVTTRTISAPVGCHHCAEAPCVDACPTGCLFTDDEHVGVHPDKCIGCRNCVLACPYGAVEIVTEKLPPEPEAASGTEAAAASAQDDKGARARARAKKRKRTKSTVVKCDLCLDRAGPGVRGGVSHQGAAAHRCAVHGARAAEQAQGGGASVRVVRQHEAQRGSGRGGVGSWKSIWRCARTAAPVAR